MNPIRLFKMATRANRLLDLFTRASRDWDTRTAQGADMSKSLFASRTFWFNVLSIGAELSGILPLPAGTVTVISNVINIGLRMVTSQPVSVIPSK